MRYFFHLEDGTCLKDEQGEELPNDEAAIVVARAIARDLGKNNPLSKEWNVVARDQEGRTVATIRC
jgi:hypothetical protein